MNRSIALVLPLLAAGCMQASDKYPSLALRPIETRSDAEPAPPPPAPATPDAALDARIATLSATLAKTDVDFTAAAARAETAAKAPGAEAVGSDSWVGAQTALADSDTLRGDTMGVLTDLERLTTDRGAAGDPPYPGLDSLRAKTQEQLDTQTARIAAIKARLGEK